MFIYHLLIHTIEAQGIKTAQLILRGYLYCLDYVMDILNQNTEIRKKIISLILFELQFFHVDMKD